MKEHNDRMSDQVKSAKESLKSAQNENHELQVGGLGLREMVSYVWSSERKLLSLAIIVSFKHLLGANE
jgi:hypothetical protein